MDYQQGRTMMKRKNSRDEYYLKGPQLVKRLGWPVFDDDERYYNDYKTSLTKPKKRAKVLRLAKTKKRGKTK